MPRLSGEELGAASRRAKQIKADMEKKGTYQTGMWRQVMLQANAELYPDRGRANLSKSKQKCYTSCKDRCDKRWSEEYYNNPTAREVALAEYRADIKTRNAVARANRKILAAEDRAARKAARKAEKAAAQLVGFPALPPLPSPRVYTGAFKGTTPLKARV